MLKIEGKGNVNDLTDFLSVPITKKNISLFEESDTAVYFYIISWNSIRTLQEEYEMVCEIEGGRFIKTLLALYLIK